MARHRRARGKKRAGRAASPDRSTVQAPSEGKTEAKTTFARIAPHLVAVFVLFHVVANCVSAIPDLSLGLDRRAWSDPRARRELQAWADRLGMEREALEDRLYSAAVSIQETRSAAVAPFAPYMKAAGLRQSWPMFAAGSVVSDRFAVKMRRCGLSDRSCGWETLFVYADPAHAWRSHQLGHPRVRSATYRWGWAGYRQSYRRGCDAIARLVFEDFEDAVAVQCGFYRRTLPSPSLPVPPPAEWSRELVVTR